MRNDVNSAFIRVGPSFGVGIGPGRRIKGRRVLQVILSRWHMLALSTRDGLRSTYLGIGHRKGRYSSQLQPAVPHDCAGEMEGEEREEESTAPLWRKRMEEKGRQERKSTAGGRRGNKYAKPLQLPLPPCSSSTTTGYLPRTPTGLSLECTMDRQHY